MHVIPGGGSLFRLAGERVVCRSCRESTTLELAQAAAASIPHRAGCWVGALVAAIGEPVQILATAEAHS